MTGNTASVDSKDTTAKTAKKRTGAVSKSKSKVTKKNAATDEGALYENLYINSQLVFSIYVFD